MACWWHCYVPACRARLLLADAAVAAADTFVAARQQRLVSHCWSGWTAAVVVGTSARSAAMGLLRRAHKRQLLRDWRAAACSRRQQRRSVLAEWRAAVQEEQVGVPWGGGRSGVAECVCAGTLLRSC
jgi:hypothetical protein